MTATGNFDYEFPTNMGYSGGDMPLAFEDTVFDNTATNHSPHQDVEGDQCLGWQSPTASQYAVSIQGSAGEMVWPAGPMADHIPAVQDATAEIAALKARLAQLETPKTPVPRKSILSRSFDTTSPPKRPYPVETEQGPIQGMWSGGVSPEQRAIIGHAHTSSPAASTPCPSKKRRTTKKDTTPKKTSVTKQQKNKKKKNKSSRSPSSFNTFTFDDGQLTLSAEALSQPIRPATELLDLPWNNLSQVERATLLLPMLQGNDPKTRQQLDAPGSLAPHPHAFYAQFAQLGETVDEKNDEFTTTYEGRSIVNGAEPTYQLPAQDLINSTYLNQDLYDDDDFAEQISQSVDQDFGNYVDPEERRYIEDVAEPAFFNHAHDFNNDATVAEQNTSPNVPADQSVFDNFENFNSIPNQTFYEHCNNVISEQNTNIELPIEQGAMLSDFQSDDWTSSGETGAEYTYLSDDTFDQSEDDINAQMLAAFNNQNQTSTGFFNDFMGTDLTSTNTLTVVSAADQTAFDSFFGNVDTNANNGDSDDFFDLPPFISESDLANDNDFDFDAMNTGAERQRLALEKFKKTGGSRR